MNENESGSAIKTIRSHAVGVVLYNIPGRGLLRIAAMYYRLLRKGVTLRVFMGRQGTTEDRPETIADTMMRELQAEAFSIRSEPVFELESNKLVYWQLGADQDYPDKETDRHLKAFFCLRLLGGGLRDDRLIEHEGTENEEILDPPQLYFVNDLVQMMVCPKVSILSHIQAVIGAIHLISSLHPDIATAYRHLLGEPFSPFLKGHSHNEEEEKLVGEYLDRMGGRFQNRVIDGCSLRHH